MDYDDRPWLKHYDPGMSPEAVIPERSLVDHYNAIGIEYANSPAMHFIGRTLTFGEFLDLTNSFANGLIAAGIAPGDIVGINLPNIPQNLVAQIGALKAGCAASGMSPLLTSRELVHQLNDSQAKVIVTLDAIFAHRLLPVVGELTSLEMIVVAGVLDFLPWYKRTLGKLLKKVPTGKVIPVSGKHVTTFGELLRGHSAADPAVPVEVDQPCLVMYTGGTTGVPKGSVITHRNMGAELELVTRWLHLQRGTEVILSGFPFFHIAGLALGLGTLYMGCVQILIPNPRDTGHIVKEMATYRPTVLVNVPSLYMMLLETPGFSTLDFSRLSMCLSAASPFPAEAIHELESVVGPDKVVEAYGMTELSSLATSNPRKGLKKVGSVGLPLPGTQMRLVDLGDRDKPVPVGQEGEIIVSGPQVMREYLNRPDETSSALREYDGQTWLHTGDVARMDEDGYFYIVDRAKDMLNVGGFKVFSREVEEKLYEHPAIEFCAIIGIPNPKRPGTDIVKLVLQPAEDHRHRDPDELKSDIEAFARKNFSAFKVPKVIEITEAIPLTTVGKVDKKALRTP